MRTLYILGDSKTATAEEIHETVGGVIRAFQGERIAAIGDGMVSLGIGSGGEVMTEQGALLESGVD